MLRFRLAVCSLALLCGCIDMQLELHQTARIIVANHVRPVDDEEALVRSAGEAMAAAAGEPVLAADSADDAVAKGNRLLATKDNFLTQYQRFDIAVEGMVASLRDHSKYFTKDEVRNFGSQLSLQASKNGDFVTVIYVAPGSVPARNGMEEGDEIFEINGHPIRKNLLEELFRTARDAPDQHTTVSVHRRFSADRTIDLGTSPIFLAGEEKPVCHVLGGNVLYLRPIGLTRKGPKEMLKLAEDAGATAKQVMLDLRDNQGGLLMAGVDYATLFLENKRILSLTENSNSRSGIGYSSSPGKTVLTDARLLVLVNERTDEGAAAIAAALQDNNRALLIGEPSNTNGYIDRLFTVFNGGKLRVTTALILRATGERLIGVKPDVPVAEADSTLPPVTDVDCDGLAPREPVKQEAMLHKALELLARPPEHQ